MRFICVLFALLISVIGHSQEWATLLQNFEQYAEQSRQKCQAVGMSVAIVKDGKVVYAKGFGQRGLDNSQPVTPETIFQIGSMSKSFTSALTALAVDRKLLQWNDLVINRMPKFFLYDPWVTRAFQIEDLYAQRSGLISYVGDTQCLLGFSTDRMIDNLRYFQPVTSFRSSFAYQNIFFSIGAKILESVMGKTWGALIQNEFFQPLKMNSSSTDLNSYLKSPNRASWQYRNPDGTVLLVPENFDYADWVYTYAPAGGINSNVLDMAKWLVVSNLTTLGLSGLQLTDIPYLNGLTKLKRLVLSNNHLTNVSPLAALVNLTKLDLSNNQVTDISSLEMLRETEIILDGNPITSDGFSSTGKRAYETAFGKPQS